MANAKNIEMKAAQVAEIKEKLEKATSVVLFDYRGLTVAEVTALRAEMRKNGVQYLVLKNHIFKRACEAANVDLHFEDLLHGTNAFAFGYEDAVTPAKVLKEFAKKAKKGEIKGGIIEGEFMDAANVNAIAQPRRAHRSSAWQHDVADLRPRNRTRPDRQEAWRRRSDRGSCGVTHHNDTNFQIFTGGFHHG